ncbi:hypothetical protein [Microvirga guangxiensis]|uniref:Uncharacterized protein n=1 Tax=Microvirga guangxiensis TaxID=549386 RepID=A0A1G5BKE4_9HYPH|nr:hypothetical protein [Microvirga guangxiensis]SCX90613.1 hypothetical protein SAMN02927923_00269 [Microvirga guangxiensis]
MTEEEIEIVAEELAKIGGVSWYPGREKGTLMRVVTDRYRDRARIAIEALDRYRALQNAGVVQDNGPSAHHLQGRPHPMSSDEIKPGSTVVYRPPGDRRAYPCRVVEIEGSRAYLAPILRACTDWVSIEHLTPQAELQSFTARDNN